LGKVSYWQELTRGGSNRDRDFRNNRNLGNRLRDWDIWNRPRNRNRLRQRCYYGTVSTHRRRNRLNWNGCRDWNFRDRCDWWGRNGLNGDRRWYWRII
jgi:hypothetical protein